MRADHPSSPSSLRARLPAGAPEDSPHAAQLRRGFPGLRFVAPLEDEFRSAFRTESLPQIRRNLWLAVALVIGFSLMTRLVLEPSVIRLMDLIRMVSLAPLLLVALILIRSPRYQRYFPLVCQPGAPVFGSVVALLAVIGAQHGVSLVSTVVITTIFIYFMLGMLFYAALFSALLVTVSYAVAAVVADLPAIAVVMDIAVLVSVNVIAAMACYSLERANRTNFLEEQLLIETASRDGLTGIHNRRYFDDHIDRIWLQAIRDQVSLAVVLIDIDHFKAYNDFCGHQAGDECLRQVARCMTGAVRRPLDVATRYGGEEFAMVLYDVRREHVEEVARRVQAGIAGLAIAHPASETGNLTVSIGAACVQPVADRSHDGFIQLADEALYSAKERGRNCFVIMDKEYARLRTGSFRKSAADSASVV